MKDRACFNCIHRGKLSCPNSSLCYALKDKPFFEAKYKDPCIAFSKMLKKLLKKKMTWGQN